MIADTRGGLLGIFKRFSRRGPWVLNGIDLEMDPGSRTVVVGGNGSGKSTLLRIAAGVTHPTNGRVAVPHAVGYVPERLAARSRFTGAEYVAHMGRIKGLDAETVAARSRELFERLDLQPGPTVLTDALSKGNRQKLVIAQAFLGSAGLLVLDEPFSGLDPTAHRSLGELIDEARAKGTSVLISAHYADRTLGADRVYHIGDGRLEVVPHYRTSTPTPNANEQRVELVATDSACPHEQIADLLGVRSVQRDELGVTLLLIVERSHTDAALSTAIALGWSVMSVGEQGHGMA